MKYPVKHIGIKHLDWIGLIKSTEIPSFAKLIAHTLSTYMNKDQDMAWPSLTRIQHEASLSRASVCKYLLILEDEGWLLRHRGSVGKNTRYLIAFPKVIETALASTQHGLGSTPDGLELVRDTDTNHPLNHQSNRVCTKSGDLAPIPVKATPPKKSTFEQFWDVWPVKRNKKKAKSVWQTKKLDDAVTELIADVQDRMRHDQQWKKGFIPHCSTYLTGERWEDSYEN